jgi:hypothetical protein
MKKAFKHGAFILGIFCILSFSSCLTVKRMPPGQQKKILHERNASDYTPGREEPGHKKK